LLGRTAAELVSTSPDLLRYLEQRLLFLRITFGFGWARAEGEEEGSGKEKEKRKEGGGKRKREEGGDAEGAVGRLCVWGVRM
jgi:hypothetical protein